MAAQYRQLPDDVAKKRAGIIKEAEAIKGRMATAKAAGEDTSAHESALAGLGDRHARLLEPYKIAETPAAANAANGGVARKVPSRAVKLDTAAEDADIVERAHRAAGGKAVKGLDREAIAAADKDKSWESMTPEEQQAAARASSPVAKPAGVAHSTSTPGGTNQTAMAAAMAKAGVAAPAQAAPAAKPAAKETKAAPAARAVRKVTVSEDVAAHNNMAVPRIQNDLSVLGGLTVEATGDELQAAKDAAARGTRNGGAAAERRAGMRRSAASTGPSVRGGQQFAKVGGGGENASSAPGRDWLTPDMIKGGVKAESPAPAKAAAPKAAPTANAAPIAPAPTGGAGGQATPPAGPMEVIGSKPKKGVIPAHMASSAPDRMWLTPQERNKAVGGGKKAAKKEPPQVVAETPEVAPQAGPARKLGGRSAPSSAAAVGNVNRSPMSSDNEYSSADRAIGGVRHNIGPAMAQVTPMAAPQAEKAASASRPDSAPPARGGGRTGAAPRSGEVGGGRVSGGSAGGLHIANEGDNNVYSNIGNTTHVVNVHNYGTMTGNSIGGEGGTPRSPAGRGGGGEPAERPASGGKPQGFNAWYKDSTGKHDLRAGLDHVTGRTGGSGERLDKGKPTVGGGSQRPLKGSARSSSTGSASPAPTATGTTHNWTGPVHQAPQSASGNGTAQQKTVP